MSKTTKKTLPIGTVSYNLIKGYCKEKNLKISGWAEAVLIKEIEYERRSAKTIAPKT